jgi:hypothetical protein
MSGHFIGSKGIKICPYRKNPLSNIQTKLMSNILVKTKKKSN